jgi:hypothetical protein
MKRRSIPADQCGCLPVNIDAMRWIDRYVGVPLCAIATPLVRLWHMAFARAAGSAPRVLFIEMLEMGKHDPRRAGDAEGARAARRAA